MLTVQQSLGWEHYEVHEPEPHILLFKFESYNSTRWILADQKIGDLSITFHQANRDTAELVQKRFDFAACWMSTDFSWMDDMTVYVFLIHYTPRFPGLLSVTGQD